MSSVATKSLLLSQPKSVQGETQPIPTLSHTTSTGENTTLHRVEIPGVDPSTVDVSFEGSVIQVSCERGQLSISVPVTTDTSKIRADIQWGILTLAVPVPAPPASHSIKVSIHDAVKQGAPRAKAKGEAEFTSVE